MWSEVEAAIDRWALLGAVLKECDQKDGSGTRRHLAELLRAGDYERCQRWLSLPKRRFNELRKQFAPNTEEIPS